MRGALVHGHQPAEPAGIIPADAGSTQAGHGHSLELEDHPRGCGEHMHHMPGVDLQEGSSPRMRGAPSKGIRACRTARIIPADAGSTLYRHMGVQGLRGSSPRMRGAHDDERPFLPSRRIIPADAGSTTVSKRLTTTRKDHPRGCGEHPLLAVHMVVEQGSSPRMRGAQISP